MEEKNNKVKVYLALKDDDKVNALGDQGWGLTINDVSAFHNGFPVLVSMYFDVPKDSKIIKDVALRWLYNMANSKKEHLEALKKHGFSFTKVHQESTGKTVYEPKVNKEVTKWRIEANWSDKDEKLVYITFGNPMLMTPCLANKEIIDKYVPKSIIEAALQSGSIIEGELEESSEETKGDA